MDLPGTAGQVKILNIMGCPLSTVFVHAMPSMNAALSPSYSFPHHHHHHHHHLLPSPPVAKQAIYLLLVQLILDSLSSSVSALKIVPAI